MLYTTEAKTKCDVKNCKNAADYYFEVKGRAGKCFLCGQCFDALVSDALKKRAPKSPVNSIRKQMSKKEKENAYVEKQ